MVKPLFFFVFANFRFSAHYSMELKLDEVVSNSPLGFSNSHKLAWSCLGFGEAKILFDSLAL